MRAIGAKTSSRLFSVVWNDLFPVVGHNLLGLPALAGELPESVEPASVIGTYLIGGRIGQGKFADVYSARDTARLPYRDAAAKVVHKGKIHSLQLLLRLNAEVEIMVRRVGFASVRCC